MANGFRDNLVWGGTMANSPFQIKDLVNKNQVKALSKGHLEKFQKDFVMIIIDCSFIKIDPICFLYLACELAVKIN